MVTKAEKQVLMEMAERVVTIPEGQKRGRWTREMRVALVYSVLYKFYTMKDKQK